MILVNLYDLLPDGLTRPRWFFVLWRPEPTPLPDAHLDPANPCYWRLKKLVWKDDVLYEDATGYLLGHVMADGVTWLDLVVVYEECRGRHKLRPLMSHLPRRCRLLVQPQGQRGPTRTTAELVRFYRSLGFVGGQPDGYGNVYMERL